MKSNKRIILPLLLLTLTATGCNSNPHVHNYDKENIEWGWFETSDQGYTADAVFHCLGCEDEQVVDATVNNRVVREATCSTNGEKLFTATVEFEEEEYTSTKTQQIVDTSAHNYINKVDEAYLHTAATCTEDAVYYKSCEYCNEATDVTFVDLDSKLGHDLDSFTDSESTCKVSGNIAYDKCERCNKYFVDGVETSWSDIELPRAHKMSFHKGKETTCTEDGLHNYYTCEYEPGVLYKDSEGTLTFASEADLVIKTEGHKGGEWVTDVKATCSTQGHKYQNCSKCGTKIDEAIIPTSDHTFKETGTCVSCTANIKDHYSLKEVTNLDTVDPITVSDLGIKDNTTITASHTFVNYDFNSKKALNLWMDYNYKVVSGDSHFYFYLFNQKNEDGVILRLQNTRIENDGIVPIYLWTNSSNGSGTTMPKSPTMMYFPRQTGVKDTTDNVIHVTAYCINETNNTWRISITLGVKGGTQYYPSANAEDKTNTPIYWDVELGSNFFNNGLHNIIRFSANDKAAPVIGDTEGIKENNNVVIYKNSDKELIGSTSTSTFTNINLVSEGKTFLGWFDAKGNKIKDGDTISGKVVVSPKFVTTQTNMFTLSDAENNAFGTKNGWYNSSQTVGEVGYRFPVQNVTSRYDVYFIYQTTGTSGSDNYSIFGFPYDFVDANTRTYVRINENNETALKGYIYGSVTNLGNAGAAGTDFTGANVRGSDSKTPLLIHFTVKDSTANGLTLEVEFINLATDVSATVSRTITYKTGGLYAINNPDRNILQLTPPHQCSYRITDAF